MNRQWLNNGKNVNCNKFQSSNYLFVLICYNNPASILIRGSLNKFPDLFCMDTFIDSTHMKL